MLLPIPAAAERSGVPEAEIHRWLAEDRLTPIPFAGETMVNMREVAALVQLHAPARRARLLQLHRAIGTGTGLVALLGVLVFVGMGPAELRRLWWLALCVLGLAVSLLLWRGVGIRPQRQDRRRSRSPAWVPSRPREAPWMPQRRGTQAATFRPLHHEAMVEPLLRASEDRPVLLFLHDRGSPISAAAYQQLARVAAEVWMITVDQQPDLAQAVVVQLGVRPEWPRVIVLRHGRAAWTATYWTITAGAVLQALQQHTS